MVLTMTSQSNLSIFPSRRYQTSAHGIATVAPFGWTVPAGVTSGPRNVPRIVNLAATVSPSTLTRCSSRCTEVHRDLASRPWECGLGPPELEDRDRADSSSLAGVLGKARVAPRLLGVDAV